jgi:hypothetical protein
LKNITAKTTSVACQSSSALSFLKSIQLKMSEPGPDSVPTSKSRLSSRPTKKRALTPVSEHASHIDALFARPEKEVHIPAKAEAKSLAPPPEVVTSVQGSSAGAGSGEFHVYKASRRREYERVRLMDEEVAKETADKQWEEKREAERKRDEEKLNRNKAKRDKVKARKEKAKLAKKDGKMDVDSADGQKSGSGIKKLAPKKLPLTSSEDADPTARANGGEVQAVEEIGIIIHDDD